MPYLRFLRDDRGYEHTYVLHGFQSGSRPSLLYWFRTPPSLSVGRQPLDEEALKAIEEIHPELTFDWAKMTKATRTRTASAPAGKASRTRGRRRGVARGAPAAPEPAAAPATEAPASTEPSAPATEAAELVSEGEAQAEEARAPEEHPVAALLGEEALDGLRARYAELCDLLSDSDLEPADQVAVTARLESLDPDAWRAGEETVVGIERFDREAAAIRGVLDD